MEAGKATIKKILKHSFTSDCNAGNLHMGDMTETGRPSAQYKEAFKSLLLKENANGLKDLLIYQSPLPIMFMVMETPAVKLKRLIKEF